ncbi:hypothetical protein LEP48_14040 [Isoptericola sp. NEAU-Y5]|uniref:Uncharacterized protein n=1 Tax=Isoptericola luteus TaxID=2879484 RepID=A0ABS7ZLC7_9MICO|nr:hypothetical protein [Isoptericola sp. NEAU-Y5]MCA5894459.1 hypothetical protein [Isoptericola sp. NEAU-Y5]
MTITPATIAMPRPLTRPVPRPVPRTVDEAAAAARRPTRGDLVTVDPADRRRRAQLALLELVVTRSAGRRRG